MVLLLQSELEAIFSICNALPNADDVRFLGWDHVRSCFPREFSDYWIPWSRRHGGSISLEDRRRISPRSSPVQLALSAVCPEAPSEMLGGNGDKCLLRCSNEVSVECEGALASSLY